jgi:Tfp pilus assembly protein PilF
VATDLELQALLQEARRAEREGRLPDAVAAYRRLLALSPQRPDSWFNLALLQRKIGDFDGALASYQEALDRGVTAPEEVHLNRGVIYADLLRRDNAARRELDAALALNPSYVPALLNLANLETDLGRLDAAVSTYERLFAIDPWHSEALARHAQIKSASGPDDPVVARLRAALARPATTLPEKASLAFALGKVLDDCGAYDLAFRAYAAANRYSRACAGPGAFLYDRRAHERLVDEIIGTFAPGRLKEAAPAPAARPIFVCGMFRSGSTLTEQVLAGHSQVAAGGEIDFVPALARTSLAPFPTGFAAVGPGDLARLAARYLAELARLFPGAAHVTDKRPDNYLYVGLIKSLFPEAKIVHTTRHPLDNCLSVFFLHLDHGMGYALDLMDTAHQYREYRRLMAHWKSLYGADILDFDYDALVRDPRPQVERLLAFCGLPWEEGCLEFHRVENAVKTASALQVREPLYRRASGRWRNYARHLGPLREYLADLLPADAGGR